MLINAPKVEKFKPLQKAEVDTMVTQLEEAFENGVHPTQDVKFPAMILAQLLRTIQHLGSLVPPPEKSELLDDILSEFDNDEEKSEDSKEE